MTPKMKDTLKLLKKLGGFDKNTFKMVFKSLLVGIELDNPDIVIDEIVDLYLKDESYLDYNLNIAKMYGEIYTHKEIKDMLKFYDSPLGSKIIKNIPFITQKTIQLGDEWRKSLGDELNFKIIGIIEKNMKNKEKSWL